MPGFAALVSEASPESLPTGLLEDVPFTTRGARGRPGAPINVALLGSVEDVHRIFGLAGWHAADPITLRSSLALGLAVALGRPYPRAPVSSVFLYARRQDLAFQLEPGRSARQRHHVRLWTAPGAPTGARGTDDEPGPAAGLWVGAATFDRRISVSRRSGRITHRIDPAVDHERDLLAEALASTGRVRAAHLVERGGPRAGRNVAGHPYFTDGRIAVLELDGESPDSGL